MNENMNEKHSLKILWAYDAFESDGATRTCLSKVLGLIADKTGAEVEPAYVMGPADLGLPIGFSEPWFDTYGPLARKAMESSLRTESFKGVQPPFVVYRTNASRKEGVRALLAHADSIKSNLIGVGTHARKGLPRLLLGSFAETLLLESKIPILTVGPQARCGPLDKILFATDFSEGGEGTFSQVLALARELSSEVIIYHAIQRPADVVFQSGVYLSPLGWVSVQEYLEKSESEIRERASRWVSRAKEAGIACTFKIRSGDSSFDSVPEAIMKEAEEGKVGMIAMGAQSGAISATLLGSVVRHVVRGAPCPVWVIREKR